MLTEIRKWNSSYRDFFISAFRRWFTRLCHITTMPSYKIDIARHIREMWYAI